VPAAREAAVFDLDGPPCVAVHRGEWLESVHRVAACAVDADGSTILEVGTIDVPIYLRSAAKPFIASAAVREGVVERFGLEPHEIALMAASHNGEPEHITTALSILAKIGLDESYLQCGAHPPYDPVAAAALARSGSAYGAIHNNCSGKHAGILALCRVLGADVESYMQPSNLAQQRILELCGRACGEDPADFSIGVDGCGIPVFATSLRRAATAFSRLASLRGVDDRDAAAFATVRSAMMEHPWYVGGTGEFDTVLMTSSSGRLVAKSGAEGVQGIGDLESGIGFTLKTIDGAWRACPPASVAFANDLGMLTERARRELEPFARPQVYNRAGRIVGSLSAHASRHATNRST
jgi:L-asparaginase II